MIAMAVRRMVRRRRLLLVRIDGSMERVAVPLSRGRARRGIAGVTAGTSSRAWSAGVVSVGPWWWRGFLVARCAVGRVFELIERV